jgi:uncharacterized protein (DUF58 family)
VVGLLLLAAIFFRRPDLVVLAAPVAIGAGIGLWRRPSGQPEVRVVLDNPIVGEGGEVNASIDIVNFDTMRYDLVVARLSADRWLQIAEVGRPYASAVAPMESVGIDVSGRAMRWGRYRFGPVHAHAVAADGLLISPVAYGRSEQLTVYPISESFKANDAMPRAAGALGFHRSRRPGEGGELAGVRVFAPGDRLRRIDWRVSLRTRELHVAQTLSDRDAEVVVLLDVLHEAGQSGGIAGSRSVLDTSVRAAGGIADYYMHRGDRVAFAEYGWQARRLRPSSGHRHFLTALEWLLDVRVLADSSNLNPSMIASHLISPNALVIVLTPMIDPRTAAMLARFARGGRFVIAVDTMPADLLAALGAPVRRGGRGKRSTAPAWLSLGDFTPSAVRLWRMERQNTIGLLREHGVPVVSWGGAGSLDEVLQQISRMAAAPVEVRQ